MMKYLIWDKVKLIFFFIDTAKLPSECSFGTQEGRSVQVHFSWIGPSNAHLQKLRQPYLI